MVAEHKGQQRQHSRTDREEEERDLADPAHADFLDDARIKEVGTGQRSGNACEPEGESLGLAEDLTEDLL